MKTIISIILTLISFAFVAAQVPVESNPVQSAEGQKISAEVVKLYQAKKYDEALPLAKKAIAVIENELGKNDLSLASAWRNLAYIQYKLTKTAESSDSFEKAFSIYKKNQPLKPADQKVFAELLETVAYFNATDGDLYNSEKKYLQAVELREKIGGKDSPDVSIPLLKLAEIYQVQGNYEKAAPLLNRALEVRAGQSAKLDQTGEDIYDNLYCLDTKLHLDSELERLKAVYHPSDKALNVSPPSEPKLINGGVINGKAIELAKPKYPDEAKAKRLEGTVSVQVLIDEEGKIISACAISGAREFHRVTELAAFQSRFSPTTLQGKPVKVSGIITYKFSR